ncbi:N-acetyltransferase, partial [Pseudomonas sp. MAFF212428]|nr:N-acetyltransferase [Pseudomonas brassicae]
MRALQNVREKIKQKGLRRVFNTLWERHVFYHWELLWMERDLV